MIFLVHPEYNFTRRLLGKSCAVYTSLGGEPAKFINKGLTNENETLSIKMVLLRVSHWLKAVENARNVHIY